LRPPRFRETLVALWDQRLPEHSHHHHHRTKSGSRSAGAASNEPETSTATGSCSGSRSPRLGFMVEPVYTVKALDESTWAAFAALVERNTGVFGGCWCMG